MASVTVNILPAPSPVTVVVQASPAGPVGPQGAQGLQGEQGPAGPAGDNLKVIFKQLAANESGITNSTDYKTSDTLKVPLDVGTWVLDVLVFGGGGTSYATAGSRHGLSFSGTGSFSGLRLIGSVGNALNSSYPTARNTAGFMTATNSASNSVATHYKGQAVVTVAGELSVIFGSVAAVVGNTPSLAAGSYLQALQQTD